MRLLSHYQSANLTTSRAQSHYLTAFEVERSALLLHHCILMCICTDMEFEVACFILPPPPRAWSSHVPPPLLKIQNQLFGTFFACWLQSIAEFEAAALDSERGWQLVKMMLKIFFSRDRSSFCILSVSRMCIFKGQSSSGV